MLFSHGNAVDLGQMLPFYRYAHNSLVNEQWLTAMSGNTLLTIWRWVMNSFHCHKHLDVTSTVAHCNATWYIAVHHMLDDGGFVCSCPK